MKSVKFWRTASKELSLTERMFYRDAIETLLSWHVLNEEYIELDLIKRILESEILIKTAEPADSRGKCPANELKVKLLSCF